MPPIKVTNCNDSGPGSLRAAVASAIGDETIDMRGLNCRRITLTSGAIVSSQISGNTSEGHTVWLSAESGAVLKGTIAFNEHRGGTDGSKCNYAAVFLTGGERTHAIRKYHRHPQYLRR